MKLYLVRHATATERLGGAIKRDFDRPLVDEGRQEAEEVARLLRRSGVKVDALVTSPLVRALQTAEIFGEVLGAKDKLDITDALAPGGAHKDLFDHLLTLKRADSIFLFGHMPDISELACALLGTRHLNMPFKKASVCRIDVFDLPPTTPGVLKWFIAPKLARGGKD